jgi:serine/threonine-protein kinase RsbW
MMLSAIYLSPSHSLLITPSSTAVKDQGKGFDYTALADPTAPENIDQPCGRGVFLMMQLADLVVFSDKGSTVEMKFRI